ncbi:MAG: tetratricopeptide repeat protein, partial [Bacteroidales bacterium]|nr:tetratricopeptide repeat protein [Bacteroidales bacterium]
RQKDNKYDGWVTEFVDNLKKELEATFKEEISVYFDINPHDGLLETHDVDASLKEKLKCLIFIPVISRTYCDPKSFAWEHEFKAFVEQASQDQLGLKIKLPSGNIASRVLPVSIYDLDIADIKECESVLGGVLRGIEFIYKEPGVNRPLTPNDDENKNLNKTKYRNQINKVANAIKEIIKGIQEPDSKSQTSDLILTGNEFRKRKTPWRKIAIPSVILTAILILFLLFFYPLMKSSPTGSSAMDKSIAVLPFANLSNDPEQEYFTDGMVDEIIDRLFKIGDLKVISRHTSMSYKNTTLSLREIARELNVSAILEGSVRKIDNNVRITVQLIDAASDAHLWSEIYDKDITDIFSIQSEVAQAVAKELKAVIKPEEKNLIEKIPSENLEAYDYYLLAEHLRTQRTPEKLWKAKTLFEQAIKSDPGFAKAYTGLARCYGVLALYANLRPAEAYPPAVELAYRALEIDSLLPDAYNVIGVSDLFYYFDFAAAERNYRHALKLAPNNPDVYKYFAELSFLKGNFSEAVEWDQRAMEIDPAYSAGDGLFAVHLYKAGDKDAAIKNLSKLVGQFPVCHYYLGAIYLFEGEYEKSIDELEKTLEGFSPLSITHLGIAYSKSGALNETRRMLDTLMERDRTEFVPRSMIGSLMAEVGRNSEALDYLRKGYEEKEEFILLLLNVDTLSYLNLRSDPVFLEIMGKVKM